MGKLIRLELGVLYVLCLPIVVVLALVLALFAAIYEYALVFKNIMGLMRCSSKRR